MIIKDFEMKVKENYAKYFEGSMVNVSVVNSLGTHISIDCYLAANKEEFHNGIDKNDPIQVSFWIELEKGIKATKDSDIISDQLVLENIDNTYKVAPEVEYLYCKFQSVRTRKVKGDLNKFVNNLDKYFKKLHDDIVKSYTEGKLHKDNLELYKKRVKGIE